MKIKLTSVPIEDYDKALKFYTEVLGFVKKRDIPLGDGARWITVVSPEEPDGTELLLEPNASYPAMNALRESLVRDGIPFTAFQVSDIQNEYERMQKLGVEFTMEPTNIKAAAMATRLIMFLFIHSSIAWLVFWFSVIMAAAATRPDRSRRAGSARGGSCRWRRRRTRAGPSSRRG